MNAIYVWGIAGALGGDVLLRIEDHDRIRCRPEFETALVEDLQWLEFLPRGDYPLSRQSDRSDVYATALARLRQSHHVYACGCSRKEIGGERYPGRCRERSLAEAPQLGLRVTLDRTVERFDDLLLGPQEQRPADEFGDLLVRDRDGHWTYQFAVTVDDEREGIDLVIRGTDLVTSTGRQLQLSRMLGRAAPPQYLHHPLVRHADGEKLSKSAGDTGVRELRARGLSPGEVIGRAAAAVGLIDTPAPMAAAAVAQLFQG